MYRLSLDFESYSKVDLKKVGTSRYARDPSTEVLMLAYALGKGPVQIWVPAEGETMPDSLYEMLCDPGVVKSAWNSTFERNIFAHVLGIDIPIEQWRDPMVTAHSLALPGQLDKAGKAIKLPEKYAKDSRGTALITLFSKPRKPTKNKPWTRATHETDPQAWEQFKAYNRQDVEAERAIYQRIKRWDMPAHEWRLWELDQRINDAGIPINRPMAENATRIFESVVTDRHERMREITGVDNPNSPQQLLPWLENTGQYPFEDLKKGHVERAVAMLYERIEEGGHDGADIDELGPIIEVLELRLEASRSSVKKYAALTRATDDDGVLRYTLQYAGAGRTWRWGGRIYQPQNLPRPEKEFENNVEALADDIEKLDPESFELLYPKPVDALASGIRPAAQAPEGSLFIDADLNAIENRVLGWVARCDTILDVFRDGRCPYLDFGTRMYRQSYERLWAEYKSGNKEKRTMSKPAVLGCGYMLSAGFEKENKKTGEMEAVGLLGYARGMGIEMTQAQCEHAVTTFRETYHEVKTFWGDIDKAVRRCIVTGKPQRLHMLTFDRSGPFLRIGLPSGRFLHYCRPRIKPKKMPWGDIRDSIFYEGLNDQKQWVLLDTHPGKLTENVVQAIARDLLGHGMTLADAEGLDTRIHVHDQIVALAPQDRADEQLEVLQECMSVRPDWAPDLPLKADGFTSRVFKKD